MSDTTSKSTLRLGTRGSLLARAQSSLVADELMRCVAGLKVEIVIYKTTGDQIVDRPLHEVGGKGLFTKELELALLNGEIDFAVHSLKDVPVTMPLVPQENLILAAIPPREDPRDVLVSLSHRRLVDLPPAARVGTSSLRRRCQLLAVRPDLKIEPLRGNLDTRLRKLREGAFDAVILAMAGLIRSGLFDPKQMTAIDANQLLPAAGQGALALQCRKNDERVRNVLHSMHDPATARCIEVERAIVAALNGDCHSPIASLATIDGEQLTLRTAVGASGGGLPVLSASATMLVSESHSAADRVVSELRKKGVTQLLSGALPA
jgi:hydroxymethylbilane synthase